jgi:RHS repeat-associated protein
VRNKSAGTVYDALSGLNYMHARYQDPQRGQFLSEDPVFWGKQNLTDPQSLGAYSYAEDNPVSREDPSGLASISGTTKKGTAIPPNWLCHIFPLKRVDTNSCYTFPGLLPSLRRALSCAG